MNNEKIISNLKELCFQCVSLDNQIKKEIKLIHKCIKHVKCNGTLHKWLKCSEKTVNEANLLASRETEKLVEYKKMYDSILSLYTEELNKLEVRSCDVGALCQYNELFNIQQTLDALGKSYFSLQNSLDELYRALDMTIKNIEKIKIMKMFNKI